jgi:LmbE family N-acetylglucosaminyl deacetylase
MIELPLPPGPRTVLCLGAHCDDIEIGAGGTLLQLLSQRRDLSVHWVVFGSNEARRKEALASAERFTTGAASRQITVHGFRDGFLPFVGAEVKELFEALKGVVRPDLILTHWREDRHQDHRLISDLTWNTFRDHCILEYEIPKYDGDLGQPNLYVRLTEKTARQKVANVLEAFPSQRDRGWFTEDTFLGLMRLRGVESNAPERFSEAFHCRKLILRGGGEHP